MTPNLGSWCAAVSMVSGADEERMSFRVGVGVLTASLCQKEVVSDSNAGKPSFNQTIRTGVNSSE